MNINILIDELPTDVIISGQLYKINSDFRTSLLFGIMIQDPIIPDAKKAELALSYYYPVLPNDIGEAIEKMLWFYQQGKDECIEKQSEVHKQQDPIFSFDEDANRIYAAFLKEYRIDLQDTPYLHWWKFCALLEPLITKHDFSEIVHFRAANTSGLPKATADIYRKMKRVYSLKPTANSWQGLTYKEYQKKIMNYVDKRFSEASKAHQEL